MSTGHPSASGNGAPAVRLPPVALFLVIALLMWAVAGWLPSWRMALPGRTMGSVLLLLTAGAVGIAGVRAFGHARTTVDPLQPAKASALVTSGIYRRTRNPMYVALAIALLAWVVWLGHPLSLLGIAAFVAWMNRVQIASEERALHALFGAEFERYCREVPRWL
jgi:protein-S-isoprenylcysteine O-methyltransferase Ste14